MIKGWNSDNITKTIPRSFILLGDCVQMYLIHYMDTSTGPPPDYTYRCSSAMETQATKLLVHSICADVNAKADLELSLYMVCYFEVQSMWFLNTCTNITNTTYYILKIGFCKHNPCNSLASPFGLVQAPRRFTTFRWLPMWISIFNSDIKALCSLAVAPSAIQSEMFQIKHITLCILTCAYLVQTWTAWAALHCDFS